jgi:hypothetical protein
VLLVRAFRDKVLQGALQILILRAAAAAALLLWELMLPAELRRVQAETA